MTEQTKVETDANDASPNPESSIEKRRRLLKAGLGAAPVLMSVSSRSVYACQTTRPSGFCSMKIGTSSPGGQKKACNGKSPTTWCQQVWTQPAYTHGWPTNCYPKTYSGAKIQATTCGQLFAGTTVHANKSCYDVMRGAVTTDEFYHWCVAGKLNARHGLTSAVCTEADVLAMWSDMAAKGYYEPTAGQKWTKADCVAYLKSTCSS